jgi:hypothetical protein
MSNKRASNAGDVVLCSPVVGGKFSCKCQFIGSNSSSRFSGCCRSWASKSDHINRMRGIKSFVCFVFYMRDQASHFAAEAAAAVRRRPALLLRAACEFKGLALV